MDNLLNADEICEKLNISKGLLYELRAAGLPYYQLRRAIRYSAEEVQDWLKQYQQMEETQNE